MSDDRSERYRAPALDKGLDILELLARQPGGLTRAEIVKATGRGASEIFRMIERLVARDYVSRSAEGDRYALTMKLFHLGAVYPPLHRLVTAAQPVMDGFAARAMQSVHLVIVDQDKARVVAHASSPSTWEFRLRVGATLDLFTTGSGLVLLALQDPAKARAMPGVNLAPARPVPPELDVELARIRADGYRVGDSLQLAGSQRWPRVFGFPHSGATVAPFSQSCTVGGFDASPAIVYGSGPWQEA